MTAYAGTGRYQTGGADIVPVYQYLFLPFSCLPPFYGPHLPVCRQLVPFLSPALSYLIFTFSLFPKAGSCLAGPVPVDAAFWGRGDFGGALKVGLRRSFLSLQEAWKLGRQVAIRANRGQLLPSGIQRNDSRALGPEGGDDWEKRALEHMGGAIWSSLEQFGWDHLGSPGISEGHQDSGSWGQLVDPRRLPLRFVVLALLLSVFCPPRFLLPF